ncbi:plasmid stabilization system protein ParE [Breznakibacter xylanolyticus]|uniref:Plasmid stabilization system protein ParE n=1 Tax=Breznakibacter xylanolyticus TaxID=990 RepID=A0A2W7NE34_9BACT|nr:plasmid stabilization system protein ParE [Breznakibacter xylanolyticus]
MEIKVLWSDTALGQLHEIYDYLNFNASQKIAKNIVKGIVQKTLLHESNPLIGSIEPLLISRPFEYRFIVDRNYKVIYRFNDHIVRIVSVFDCRQNPGKIEDIEQ